MPWQEQWFYVIGEVVTDPETGIVVPAYPEAFATLMRQQGKTGVAEGWMWDRLIAWKAWDNKPQSVAYTAQKGADGRAKFRKDLIPTWQRSPLWKHAKKPRFMADDTGLNMVKGGNLSVLASSESSGHGLVLDAAFLDEIFADIDNRREQTLVPAMATRHDRQKLICSTAGDEGSVLFAHKQQLGRQAVDRGMNEGIAYLEFSADPKDPQYDPESPTTWRRCMPALGITITERMVRQAFNEMINDPESGGVEEFERAWLNIPKTASGQQVIPPYVWASITDPDVTTDGRVVLAADGDPENTWGTVAAADEHGNALVVAHEQGQGWMTSWLIQKATEKNAPVVVDMSGPVRGLADRLAASGVRVIRYTRQDYASACGDFYDACIGERVRIRSDDVLASAVAAGRKQLNGDLWTWKRKDTVSVISPLVAVTLALHAAGTLQEKPDPGLVFAVLD